MTSIDALTTVLFDVSDNVATITLNRPDRLNAFNHTMALEFGAIWTEVRENDEIRAVVVRAAGDRAFCTGVDLAEGPWWTHLSSFHQEDPGVAFGAKANNVWKPVIGAVHGMAAGGAFYFLNECDFLVCSEEATFFDPHANGGIVSSLEPIGMLQRGVPLGDVMRWALTGNEERLTAATALRLGLVTEVVASDVLWDHVHGLASEIATRHAPGIEGTVRAVWESLDKPASIAKRQGLSYTQIGNTGGAPSLAREKRKPRFR
ncbi:MAG: putative enoyl-CoA hydratase/isomerase [Aeromicrobium sp.]|nr:putative enoyl-CoA hydratase/isomerase [Aeromicrobium sp.]